MILFKLLYWVALIGAVFALVAGTIMLAQLFHRSFKRYWFLFPFLLIPPLFLLVQAPQLSSLLWRFLALFCVGLMLWSMFNGALASWLWIKPSKPIPQPEGLREDEEPHSQSTHSTVLTWEEALQIVLALEERRWGLGFPLEWLVTQCQGLPILLEALEHLKARGHVGDAAKERHSASSNSKASHASPPPQAPHEILGVAHDASAGQIKDAYREQMKRYHPDRLHQFGPEFAALATEKTKLIQQAFEHMLASRPS